MKWVKRWGYEMAERPTRTGIYRLRTGGFFIRTRVKGVGERSRALHDATLAEAQRKLDELVIEARAEARGEVRSRQTWSSFAASRLQERIRKRKIMSEATVDRWKEALPLFIAEWGHLDVRAVTRHHYDQWINGKVAEWMSTGKTVMRKRRVDGKLVEKPVTTVIKATTVNGWLRVLRALSNAAKVKFDLPKSPFEGIEFFEEGDVYTEEAPNALPPKLFGPFMALAEKHYPQHLAMIWLLAATGQRPSALRPLRRRGPEADVNWETGKILIRRSQSRKGVMPKTKTGKKNSFTVPKAILDKLEKHVAAFNEKQAKTDLLFPSARTGGFLTRNVLAKPFEWLRVQLGIPYKLTPRGMRRSFQDFMREAEVDAVITRAISGHQSDDMRIHYSTARDEETRDAIAKVVNLAKGDPDEVV